MLGNLLEQPLSRPITTAGFAAATNTASQLITTGRVDPSEVLVSAGSAALVSAFEPWVKPTAPAAPLRQPRPPEEPAAYSVGFEMTLDPKDLGRRREVHFNRANKALDQAFKSDPSFQTQMEQEMPGAGTAVSSTGGRDEPSGWTWHHAPTSVTQGRVGVMQLVPTVQHTPGTAFYRLMHPDGFGGYSEWAIPAGAPPNR